MLPVMILSDGSIANSAEPWLIPRAATLPDIQSTELATAAGLGEAGFEPYRRDLNTLARPWPVLGTPGLQHRLGGLEKWDGTGHISYDGANHHQMTKLRQARVDRIAKDLDPIEVHGEASGDVLVISWGSTWGACLTAVHELQAQGKRVSLISLRWINPLPADLGAVIGRFSKILVPEINNGQLIKILRAGFDFDGQGYNRIEGQPLTVSDLRQAIAACLPS